MQQAEREIRNVALLDLTGATSDEVLDGVGRIVNVAAILVPERLLGKLMGIPMENVAATVPVPEGKRVRVMSGQVTLSGEALTHADGPTDEILVVAGQLIITSAVQRVDYAQVIAIGQVVAPVGSEAALGASLTRMTGQLVILGAVETVGYQQVVAVGQIVAPREHQATLAGHLTALGGQVVYYSANPRIFDGKDSFSGGFFELLEEPTTLVLSGKFVFEDDVSPELLKRAVAEIVLSGKVIAPRALVPMLQVLTVARSGRITTDDTEP